MINIIGKWYWESDVNCLILTNWDGTFAKPDKRGLSFRANVKYRYYSNMSDLLDGTMKHLMRERVGKCNSLEELSVEVKDLYDLINKIKSSITLESITESSESHTEDVAV